MGLFGNNYKEKISKNYNSSSPRKGRFDSKNDIED